MSLPELLTTRREAILAIARAHGVRSVRVFGSATRGELTAQSDVDFLIEVEGPTTPWFPGGLVFDLEQELGRRVDVVEADAIHVAFRERILREAVPL